MRIDDKYPVGVQVPHSGQTPSPQQLERLGELRNPENRAGSSVDQVQLSPLAGGLSRLLARINQERTERVNQLQQLYAEGRYTVDVQALARTLAREILSLPLPDQHPKP